MGLFFSLWLKLFFVFTPFFGLTMFLTMTDGFEEPRRRNIALTTSVAVLLICLVLFFAGNQIFSLFGITLDSFRIGAGVLLFLSGIALVQGNAGGSASAASGDVSVVPLAIPIIVGPATMGTLLVLGAELVDLGSRLLGCLALLFAVASIAGVLLMGSAIQERLGTRGISILSKLTGLVLAALAAQMIMTGIQGFLGIEP
ncbi:MarC family protein [Desulfonatronovibrio hydrogenovorans]|uniref:MarC family protein n=1 Tax=Desulfonatronovibrio hydrogenovorans TaxID=53245 RepID=UPI00048A446E|nr:MarC family protein [Desulfonatronovibrio hydrogenovorans]